MSLENEIVKLIKVLGSLEKTIVRMNDGFLSDTHPTLPEEIPIGAALVPEEDAPKTEPEHVEPISAEQANEINKKMGTVARNLGTAQPLKDLLAEFEINSITMLASDKEAYFIERLEAL